MTYALRRSITNSSYGVATQIVGLFGSCGTSILLARFCSVDGLGLYAFAGGFASIFVSVTSFALATILAREVARNPSVGDAYLRAGLGLTLMVCLPLALVASGSAALLLRFSVPTTAAISLLAVMQAIRNTKGVVFGYMHGHSRFHQVTVIEGLIVPTTLGVGALALWGGGGIFSFIVSSVFAEAILVAGLLAWLHARTCSISGIASGRLWRQCAVAGVVVSSGTMVAALNLRADVIVLGMLGSPSDVGLYSAAFTFYVAIGTFVTAVSGGWLPNLSHLHGRDHVATRWLLRVGAAAVTGAGLAAAALLAVSGRWLMSVAFGDAFAGALPALYVLGVAVPAMAASRFLLMALTAFGAQGLALAALCGGTAVHVATTIVLLKRFGIVGAAAGTLAGEISLLVMTAWITSRVTGKLRASAAIGLEPTAPPAPVSA